ncbi:MAG TPA: hypothetical protein VII92_12215 [Anaerolineae bacterium]
MKALFIDATTLINILTLLVVLLSALVSQPFLGPDVVRVILLIVALLNVVLKFLRGEPLILSLKKR